MKHNTQGINTPPDSSRLDLDKDIYKLNKYIQRMKKCELLEHQKNICEEIIRDMKKYIGIATCSDYDGTNLLMAIAKLNKNIITVCLVKKILKMSRGIINAVNVNDKNNSALLYAAISGNTSFLEEAQPYILNNDKKIKNNDNKTAFILATENNKIDFLKEMFELEIISLKEYKDFNISKEEKEHSLLIAANHGHVGIVDLLISKGADINTKNTDDKTPLMLAIENNNYEIISIIRKQSSLIRLTFTADCFLKMIAEQIYSYQKKYLKSICLLEKLEVSIIKPIMSLWYSAAITVNVYSPNVKYNQNLSQYIFHPIENYFVTSQREKYFIDCFYGTSSDHSMTSEHHPLGSTNDTQPELRIDPNNNSLIPTRYHENLSVVAELFGSHTNGSEHSMSSSAGTINPGQGNVNEPLGLSIDNSIRDQLLQIKKMEIDIESDELDAKKSILAAARKRSDLNKIKNQRLEQSPSLCQETLSTQSGITSRQRSVPRLNLTTLVSTEPTSNNRLSQSLSTFPGALSSTSSHQNRLQDGNNPQTLPSYSQVN